MLVFSRRWNVLSLILLLFPLGTVVGAEVSSNDARGWLERLSRASRQLSYEGTFVYVSGSTVDAMRIIHKSDNRGEQEKLIALTGEPNEVIRSNDSVTCLLPGSRHVILERAAHGISGLPANKPASFEKIGAYYDLSLDGRERIAGRLAQAVVVKSKDPYRYSYRIWVDTSTGLLLKTELHDSEQLLEQVVFTNLDVRDSIADGIFKPSQPVKRASQAKEMSESKVSGGEIDIDVAWMPDGFALLEKNRRRLSVTGNEVNHVSLFDGLTTISVFVEPTSQGKAGVQSLRKGAINAHSVVLDGNQITAVGEVPAETVKRIAESVRRASMVSAQP